MDGLHVLANLYRCRGEPRYLTDAAALRNRCIAAIQRAGLTVLGDLFRQFPGSDGAADPAAGVTGCVVLAESHVAIHTWPEIACVTLDAYVCNYSRDNTERARALGLGEFLIVSRGEETQGGRERPSALADAYEAVLGAVLLDGGFDLAREFIGREFHPLLHDLTRTPILDNPKGELQELLQAVSPAAPQYRVVSATGPDSATGSRSRSWALCSPHSGRCRSTRSRRVWGSRI